jgi:hypothetical protein
LIPIESDVLSTDLPSAGHGPTRPFAHGRAAGEAPISVPVIG